MTLRRSLAALAVLTVAVLTVAAVLNAAEAAPRRTPVLGSAAFQAPVGEGWGTAHPESFFNGGDPSGLVFDLRWTGWGDRRAVARGRTWLLKPEGGYYRKPGRIEVRAERLGTCADGTYAYRRLVVRGAERPRGPLSTEWSNWSHRGRVCG